MSANLYVIEDYENETVFRPKKTNPIQTQTKPVLRAVEKFLSLYPESATIIRKFVIRQLKRGRLRWRFLGTVTKRILEHSPVASGLNLEICYYVNTIFFGEDGV